MNNLSPLVSIIVCTYNRALYLEKALNSIVSQSYSNFEVIVVNDGSSDNTANVLKKFSHKFPLFIINHDKNRGIFSSRNEAISYSKASYLAILDDDDFWVLPNKLSDQVGFLESHPSVGVCGTWFNVVSSEGLILRQVQTPTQNTKLKSQILYHSYFLNSTLIIRRSAFIKVGYNYLETNYHEDLELILRIGCFYDLSILPIFSTCYRLHSTNVTRRWFVLAAYRISIIYSYRKKYPGFFLGFIRGIIQLIHGLLPFNVGQKYLIIINNAKKLFF